MMLLERAQTHDSGFVEAVCVTLPCLGPLINRDFGFRMTYRVNYLRG
jgi:hypothetical protein